jgi:hypothetical protein
LQQQKSKKKSSIVGSFNYSDPAAALSINGSKISSLSFSGNSAHFTGTANSGGSGKKGGKKSTISFTVDVTDNGSGTSDTFSIQTSTGYSASGNLTSGDITIH